MTPENKTQVNTNKMIKPSKRSHPDSDTYSDSEIEESTTYFPSFLESVEDKPIKQLTSSIIEKSLSANVALKSVKATCNNTLIVEVKNKKYVELLLRTTTTQYENKSIPSQVSQRFQGSGEKPRPSYLRN